MNYLKMTGYIVRTASDNWTLGYEGENNARTLRVKTTDSLTNFATVNLLIDTLDCGVMTVEAVSNYKVLSMVLTAGMLGEAGMKTCQLLMMDSDGTVIKKSNQFYMVVGASNDIEGTVPEGPVIIAISDYVEEKVDELLDNFTIATDTTLTRAGMAADAKSVGDAITLTSAETSTLTGLLN